MTVLGMNQRNALIAELNPRAAIRRVNDKHATKRALLAASVPAPETLRLVASRAELMALDFEALPDSFALKPNRGRRGEGIVLAARRQGDGWATQSGRDITRAQLIKHITRILDGEFSLEGARKDSALIEPLIRAHADIARLVPEGLPDVRVICLGAAPLLAMARLPTAASGGRANLHQGAVGAAIDLATGRITRAVAKGRPVERHPDTGAALIGAQIPFWNDVLSAASRCGEALELGYLGADIVIDAVRGVRVLECNAFPGLEIQNVNARGLLPLIRAARDAAPAIAVEPAIPAATVLPWPRPLAAPPTEPAPARLAVAMARR